MGLLVKCEAVTTRKLAEQAQAVLAALLLCARTARPRCRAGEAGEFPDLLWDCTETAPGAAGAPALAVPRARLAGAGGSLI